MRTVEEIVEEIKLLSPQERLCLIEKITHLNQHKDVATESARLTALDVFLALAGTAETDSTDVASDKYKHLTEIYADNHEHQ